HRLADLGAHGDHGLHPGLGCRRTDQVEALCGRSLIMLTLLGSLLGFLSSTFPEFLKLFRDSQDRKHVPAILDRQMEQQRLGHSQRLEEIQIAADVAESLALYSYANHPTGSPWVEGLQASVRPVITYAFFLVVAVESLSDLTTFKHTNDDTQDAT